MKQLLALLLFVPSLCAAQAPHSEVLDGLVAWFSFDSTYCDEISGLCFNPNSDVGFQSADSFTAVEFSGGFLEQPPREDLNLQEFSILIRCQTPPLNHIRFWKGSPDYPDNVNFYLLAGFAGRQFDASPQCNEILDLSDDNDGYFGPMAMTDQWIEVLITRNNSGGISFHNGITTNSYQGSSICTESAPTRLGWWWDGDPNPSAGMVDHLGIWNRVLSDDEITLLFSLGCTNPEACNFDSGAQIDDGSCIDCEWASQFCGEGTVWDSTLQECVGVVPPADSILVPFPSCGEGTVWDPVNEECIIAIPADLNYDGCVTVNDLLVLLAVHGTCPSYPEWPDEPTDTTWTCGAPLTYWDYDYATVLIGDQCWFAENLRTTLYANGDSIPSGLTDGEWASTTTGATAVFGEGSSNCINWVPEILDACNDLTSLEAYGRLYNWYAVDDIRNLCAAGWHVASDDEWTVLENFVGEQGFSGIEGEVLKSTYGWYNNGNGSNEFGFKVFPAGNRNFNDAGTFRDAGWSGYFWRSTSIGDDALGCSLGNNYGHIHHQAYSKRNGFSVRCVKD